MQSFCFKDHHAYISWIKIYGKFKEVIIRKRWRLVLAKLSNKICFVLYQLTTTFQFYTHNSLPLGHLLLPNCSLDQLNCVKIKRCTPDKGWRDSLHDIVKFNCYECCCCFCCPCCEINIENKWATKSCKMTSLPKSWVIKRNKKSAETFFFFRN